LLSLQRSAGNAAVTRLLQRWPAAAVAMVEQAAEDKAKAREIFARGAKWYELEKHGHAYDFFMRAYELDAHPAMLFSAAQALRKLGGRREEAIALYERYLAAEGGTRREEAERYLAELRGPSPTGYAPVDQPEAEAAFAKGAAYYDAGLYGHAYDEFTRAYQLEAHPAMLFSAAQALRRLGGRREEAIALYERYLAAKGGTRREEAERYLAELREFGAAL
jgi:tetratricopeptide (TPR) repeat protein